jgi:hypothetical protein
VRPTNGKIVDLTTEGFGELCGFYGGSPNWREKYTQEQFVDDYRIRRSSRASSSPARRKEFSRISAAIQMIGIGRND